MKIGDKVKILCGRKAGMIGTVKTAPGPGVWEVEIPRVERFCRYSACELEVVPPSQDLELRAAATRVLLEWPHGHMDLAIRELFAALNK